MAALSRHATYLRSAFASLRAPAKPGLAILALATLAVACSKAPPRSAFDRAAPGDDVTLYRDAALIRQRIELTLPATPITVKATLASGVAADQIVLLDRGGLTITSMHAQTTPGHHPTETGFTDVLDPLLDYAADDPPPEVDIEPEGEGSEHDDPEDEVADALPDARKRAKPTELRLDVQAPRAGTYAIVVGYVTDRLRWDVAYTMTAAPSRDRGELRGALAIRNETGIAIKVTTARVIDAELAAWRGKTAEQLAARLIGATQSSTPPAAARELGHMELGDGETRVDVVQDPERRMRSVLVYDPIGTKLDNTGPTPVTDHALGTTPKASHRVTESFEVARNQAGSAGLPSGPVRLLERKPDGSLAVIGESRLFDASTRVSDVDTIAIGTADGVTASRERREITVDEQGRRLTEEIMITIDNKRAIPVEVLVREHLYRGQNWTLAFYSAPEATKDGPQQISLRTRVPPKSQSKLLYVVVYTWGSPPP